MMSNSNRSKRALFQFGEMIHRSLPELALIEARQYLWILPPQDGSVAGRYSCHYPAPRALKPPGAQTESTCEPAYLTIDSTPPRNGGPNRSHVVATSQSLSDVVLFSTRQLEGRRVGETLAVAVTLEMRGKPVIEELNVELDQIDGVFGRKRQTEVRDPRN
jgi:hypothetical protein